MARFFFHLHSSSGIVEDEEGQDLADADAARKAAIASIRSIVSEETKAGLIDLRGSIEVVDLSGSRVLELPFSDAVDVRMGPPPVGEQPR